MLRYTTIRYAIQCYHVLVATDNKLNALCTRIHMAQILAVIMQSKRFRLERVGGAPRHRFRERCTACDPQKHHDRPRQRAGLTANLDN